MILDYLVVVRNTEIAKGVYEAVFECGETPVIKGGQFINIYPKNPELTLPRPISVCDVEKNRLRVIYEVVGKGTEEFSGYKAGDSVKVMYPLGNGFNIAPENKNHVLVAGSLGAAPLLLLAKSLKGKINVFLGFGEQPVLVEDFRKIAGNIYVATANGTYGEKGTVIDILKKHDTDGQVYYGCGPLAMLEALCGYIQEKNAAGQISLDARMACGFGVCIGCAVKIKKDDGWQYLKTCSDGPVFNYKEVLWD